MKKILLMLCLVSAITATTYAQDKQKSESGDNKTKVKPNTTTGDKVHNVIHPNHKKSHGVKIKHKSAAGKTKVETGPSK